jgi:hypothetical protein
MSYKYTIKPSGIKLDLDTCPPPIGFKIFPNGGWDYAFTSSEGWCEFVFKEKQNYTFSNDFIEIKEEKI